MPPAVVGGPECQDVASVMGALSDLGRSFLYEIPLFRPWF